MKTIEIHGNATNLFFESSASFDDIFEWVQIQVMFSNRKDNIFKLNEPHSCSVSNSLDGGISIHGDEDSKYLTIVDVKAIEL